MTHRLAISTALLLLPLVAACSLFEPRQPRHSPPPTRTEPAAEEPAEEIPPEPPPAPATSEPDLDEMLKADGLLALADAELAGGDPRSAAETYARLVAKYPQADEAPQALFQLAVMQLDPTSPIFSSGEGLATLERVGDEHPDSPWAPAAAVVLRLARQNADLAQALETLQTQLEELKKLDLSPDG